MNIGDASPEVVAEIKRDVREIEGLLSGRRDNKGVGIAVNRLSDDALDMKRELASKRKWLKDYTPPKIDDVQKNTMFSRSKLLGERIAKKLVGAKEYHQLYPDEKGTRGHLNDFQRLVEHETKLLGDTKFKKDVQEWRNIMRTLEPDDPNVTSLDNLRTGENIRIRR